MDIVVSVLVWVPGRIIIIVLTFSCIVSVLGQIMVNIIYILSNSTLELKLFPSNDHINDEKICVQFMTTVFFSSSISSCSPELGAQCVTTCTDISTETRTSLQNQGYCPLLWYRDIITVKMICCTVQWLQPYIHPLNGVKYLLLLWRQQSDR